MLRLPTPIRITDSVERIALAAISRHTGADDGIIPRAAFSSLPIGAIIEPVLPSLAIRGHILLSDSYLADLSRLRQVLKNEKDRNRWRQKNRKEPAWPVRDRVGELFPSVREQETAPASKPENLPIALSAALAAENLSFTTYAAMLATKQHASEGRISIARLSACVGSSYFAIRQQVLRTPWWTKHTEEGISNVSLTDEAEQKLERVNKRVTPPDV